MIGVFLIEGCWWLGLFLLNRTPANKLPMLAGAALIANGVVQAANSVGQATISVTAQPVLILCSLILSSAGIVIAFWDARVRDENPLLPFLRSFDAALLTGLVFGLQIFWFTGSGTTPTTIILLYSLPATAIAIQVFSSRIQAIFDQFAFSLLPRLSQRRLKQARADLLAAADALPKMKTKSIDLTAIEEAEFNRLVRRALSTIGDLPKLSTSPLIYLPIVDCRLIERGTHLDTLERAVELKRILIESIIRLKPNGENFGTTPEWRHYNALYFPYVAGLKPYTVQMDRTTLESSQQKALDWFQTTVPERTLYNWQTAAAKLVAISLKTQNCP